MTKQPAAEAQRLDRLVGNYAANEDGGALPLSAMCARVLERLLDDAPAAVPQAAVRLVLSSEFKIKENRVKHIYKALGGEHWGMLAEDILTQFESQGVARKSAGGWRTGAAFKTKEMLAFAPARPKKNSHVRVIVWSKDDRAKLGTENKRQLELQALANDLLPGGPGLRGIDKKLVATLVESMKAFCDESGKPQFNARFPVVYDQHGRLLDGRHRELAARELGIGAPRVTIEVLSDADAIAYTIIADTRVGFTAKERANVAARLLAGGESVQAIAAVVSDKSVRDRILTFMEAYPGESDHLIAERAICNRSYVARVRATVSQSPGGSRSHLAIGKDGKHYGKAKTDDDLPPRMRGIVAAMAEKALASDQVASVMGDPDWQSVAKDVSKLATWGVVEDTGERVSVPGRKRPVKTYRTIRPEQRKNTVAVAAEPKRCPTCNRPL